MKRVPAGGDGGDVSPLLVKPHPTTVPFESKPSEVHSPAATAVYVCPTGGAGTVVSPQELSPHPTTVPSERRPRPKSRPAATAVYREPVGGAGTFVSPEPSCPQPTIPPSVVTPSPNVEPAAMDLNETSGTFVWPRLSSPQPTTVWLEIRPSPKFSAALDAADSGRPPAAMAGVSPVSTRLGDVDFSGRVVAPAHHGPVELQAEAEVHARADCTEP